MKSISTYYKLPFTQVNVRYGKELISFSLMKELRIDPNDLNGNLKEQPRVYGFCLLLHKKLLTNLERLKLRRNTTYGRLYFQAKGKKSSTTGRLFTEDMAKAWVEKHKQYRRASLACIEARDAADTIFACIRSLEQRAGLTQTISSNIRNEQ